METLPDAPVPDELQFESVIDGQTGEVTYRRKGRPPGSKNKPPTPERRMELLGYDPIVHMVKIAMQADNKDKPQLALKAASELAQYVAPKKKSVEVQVTEESTLDQALQMTPAERMLRITQLMNKLEKL